MEREGEREKDGEGGSETFEDCGPDGTQRGRAGRPVARGRFTLGLTTKAAGRQSAPGVRRVNAGTVGQLAGREQDEGGLARGRSCTASPRTVGQSISARRQARQRENRGDL